MGKWTRQNILDTKLQETEMLRFNYISEFNYLFKTQFVGNRRHKCYSNVKVSFREIRFYYSFRWKCVKYWQWISVSEVWTVICKLTNVYCSHVRTVRALIRSEIAVDSCSFCCLASQRRFTCNTNTLSYICTRNSVNCLEGILYLLIVS